MKSSTYLPFNSGLNLAVPSYVEDGSQKTGFAVAKNVLAYRGVLTVPHGRILLNPPASDDYLKNLVDLYVHYDSTVNTNSFYVVGRQQDSYRLYQVKGSTEFTQILAWTGGPSSAVSMSGLLYVSAEGLPLTSIKGSKEFPIDTERDGRPFTLESGKLLVYKKHLFVFSPVINGTKEYSSVYWSDMNKPNDFDVQEGSEADYFVFTDDERGIIDACLFGDTLLVVTRSSLYVVTYVGYPSSFSFTRVYRLTGISAGSLVAVGDCAYLIGDDDIYEVSPRGCNAVGLAVKPYISNFLAFPAQAVCWEPRSNTIFWSNSNGALAYNITTKNFTTLTSGYPTVNFYTAERKSVSYTVISDIPGTIAAQQDTYADAGITTFNLSLQGSLCLVAGELVDYLHELTPVSTTSTTNVELSLYTASFAAREQIKSFAQLYLDVEWFPGVTFNPPPEVTALPTLLVEGYDTFGNKVSSTTLTLTDDRRLCYDLRDANVTPAYQWKFSLSYSGNKIRSFIGFHFDPLLNLTGTR